MRELPGSSVASSTTGARRSNSSGLYRAGDDAARERAARVLGDRDRFLLSDAQFVLAREHGLASWAELRRAAEASPLDALSAVETR